MKMKKNFKNIFYLTTVILLILIIIYKWSFLSNLYHYMVYKENCIVATINNENSDKNEISKKNAIKFCECKIENFKIENIEIFVSKLRVEKKFYEKEKIINEKCKKILNF